MKFITKILIIDKIYKIFKSKIISKGILKNLQIEKYFDDYLDDNYPNIVSKMQTYASYSIALCATNGKRVLVNIFNEILKQNKKTFTTNIINSDKTLKMPIYLSIIEDIIKSLKVFKKEIKKDYFVMAFDEYELEKYFNSMRFDCLVLNNLFLDQKDDLTLENKRKRIKDALNLNSDIDLIINADEPYFYEIDNNEGEYINKKRNKFFFGFNKVEYPLLEYTQKNDLKLCPNCNCTLDFKKKYYSHLGNYNCDCGFKRPKLDVEANVKIFKDYCFMDVFYKDEKFVFKFPFGSVSNAYNALAAIAAALYLNIDIKVIESAFKNYQGTKGIDERILKANKRINIKEIKNSVSLTDGLSYLYKNKVVKVVFVFDNKDIDGIDTSWIWDSNFEGIKDFENKVYVTGQRLDDMALRIKYGGINPCLIIMEENIKTAIKCCFYELKEHEDMLILSVPSKIKEIEDIIDKLSV